MNKIKVNNVTIARLNAVLKEKSIIPKRFSGDNEYKNEMITCYDGSLIFYNFQKQNCR